MAMGKAVVSTSIGAEGLPVRHGHDILLADTPQEFAERTLSLLRQSDERLRLGRAARRLVETEYGWDTVTRIVEDVLKRVTTRGTLVSQGQA